MIKTGRVETGVTPSEQSGERSTRLVEGQALAKGEKPAENTVEKVAALVDTGQA